MPPPSAEAAHEATAEFLMRLRRRGIRDLAVLRAMETVPRAAFVPQRHADLAARDMSLPIACGQTMQEPWVVARMAEALELKRDHRVLEIGSGSGYCTAVFARLAGEVLGIERWQSLAVAARTRLEMLGVDNAAVVWADGLSLPVDIGRFDRIVVHATVEERPDAIFAALTGAGEVVMGRAGADRRGKSLIVRAGSAAHDEAVVCEGRLRPLMPGLSQTL